MLSPNKGKKAVYDGNERSPKNFRWSQPYEDTLLELLVREARQGNRPDSSFTSSAFRNVVKDFNRIHGTNISKKHVQSRIKTMKQHFTQFHGAFNGLSGFSWNHETKMFIAEDHLWDQRINENPTLQKFRDKACHNWDKLCELYGDTRATGSGACDLRERSNSIQRGINFADLCIHTQESNDSRMFDNECSSYGDHDYTKADGGPASTPEINSTQPSGGSSRSKLKRKASLISVMEEGYKTMADSIRDLSATLQRTGEKVASSKFEPDKNERIYAALGSLGLDDKYKVQCYCYLSANPSKAALLVGAPESIRGMLLEDIMKDSGVE